MNPGFAIQFLKAGKALCSAAFPNLVATWNWMAAALSNLKGDADGNVAGGHISVDWAAPSHPVVRCNGCNANPADNAANMVNVVARAWMLSLARDEDNEGSYFYSLRWCYYNKAGVSFLADDMSVDVSAVSAIKGIVAVKFVLVKNDEDDNTSGDEISAKLYASIDEVNALQDDPNIYVVPLYLMISATEWVDLRTSVQLQVFDFAEF